MDAFTPAVDVWAALIDGTGLAEREVVESVRKRQLSLTLQQQCWATCNLGVFFCYLEH